MKQAAKAQKILDLLKELNCTISIHRGDQALMLIDEETEEHYFFSDDDVPSATIPTGTELILKKIV